MSKNHGGTRPGAGRKSAYGEPTKHIRVPESQVDNVYDFLKAYQQRKEHVGQGSVRGTTVERSLPVAFESPVFEIPVMSHRIAAGFPSPADDYIEQGVDLNRHLILHPEATFLLRVSGWSMVGAGIHDGDEMIVDRSIDPQDNHIVVAVVDGTFTVKRLKKTAKTVRLVAENPEFPDIVMGQETELMIWGVVTRVLHKV